MAKNKITSGFTVENIPLESEEQQMVVAWFRKCARSFGLDPNLLLHPANEGKRTGRTAHTLAKMGLVAGTPDLFLAVPRKGFGGLWIEMKRVKKARVSEAQNAMLDLLDKAGYATAVCFGSAAAVKEITQYLSLPAPT